MDDQADDASEAGDFIVTDVLDKKVPDRKDGTWNEDICEEPYEAGFTEPGPSHTSG